MRAIAADAGVDPALVHHYFGSKDDLFMAALQLPVDPRVLLAPVLAGGAKDAGPALLRTFFGVWDDPENQLAFLSLFRSVLDPPGSSCSARASSRSCSVRWERPSASTTQGCGCPWWPAR